MASTAATALVGRRTIQHIIQPYGATTMATTPFWHTTAAAALRRHASVLATTTRGSWTHVRDMGYVLKQHRFTSTRLKEAAASSARMSFFPLDPIQYILAGNRAAKSLFAEEWIHNMLNKVDSTSSKIGTKLLNDTAAVAQKKSRVVSVAREQSGGGRTIEVEMTASDLERLLARVAASSAESQALWQRARMAAVHRKDKASVYCPIERGVLERSKCQACKFSSTCKA